MTDSIDNSKKTQSLVSKPKRNEKSPQSLTESILGRAIDYSPIKLSDLIIQENVGGKTYIVSDARERFEPCEASPRFFQSLSKKTGLRTDFFKLFEPKEVMERVIKVEGDKELYLARDGQRVLGLSSGDDPCLRAEEALTVIQGYNPIFVSYDNGEIKAHFTPARSSGNTKIIGEDYSKKFQLTVSVDGLNQPSLAPVLIRQLCTNGAVGEAAALSSQIIIGKKDAGYTIERALAAFDGDKMFSRIAEQLMISKKSWASVAELDLFLKTLTKAGLNSTKSMQISSLAWKMAGSVAYHQHLQNQGKNVKLLRRIPTLISRYDLINMVTEVRTHISDVESTRRALDALAGTLIVQDPDLELSAEDNLNKDSPAFFFKKLA